MENFPPPGTMMPASTYSKTPSQMTTQTATPNPHPTTNNNNPTSTHNALDIDSIDYKSSKRRSAWSSWGLLTPTQPNSASGSSLSSRPSITKPICMYIRLHFEEINYARTVLWTHGMAR